MSDAAKNASGGQWQDTAGLWLSLAALALSIAEKLQGIFTLADLSEWVVRNWEALTTSLRDLIWTYVKAILAIDLSWVTARLIPSLLVLSAIVGFSLRRRLAGAVGRRLGIADREPVLSTVFAFLLIFSMVVFEQSHFSLSAEEKLPPGMSLVEQQQVKQYFSACRAKYGLSDESPFDAFCVLDSWDNPIAKAAACFDILDWLIVGAYLSLLVYVVLRLQEEVFIAFILAAGFIILGHVVALVRASL